MPETPYFLRLVFAIDKKSTTGRLPTNNLRSLIAHKVEETAVKTLTVFMQIMYNFVDPMNVTVRNRSCFFLWQ